jgi:UDP-glucose:(heptosyl)LPS alpha-1,3-glucosyltransferase
VSAGDFDLVQSHERLACCDIYRAGDGLHRAWLARRERLLDAGARFFQSLSPYHRATLAAEDAMFRGSRLRTVICISELVKREIQEHFGLDDSRLPVVYNGVDLAQFNPSAKARRSETRQQFAIPEEVPLFLFLGSGFERKGLALALAALPPEAWLLVVGKDKDTARYQQLATRLGIAGRVRFAGPQKNVARFYGAADAFVFPTVYEPFGNVILEALACGLPILTTPDCGGAELVREGENGFVLPGDDAEPWRVAMGQLLDEAGARRMGEAAAATARPFDIPTMTGRMVELYTRLMAG